MQRLNSEPYSRTTWRAAATTQPITIDNGSQHYSPFIK